MSVLGTCWAQAILGKRLILENKAQIRKIRLVGKATRVEESACKGGKNVRRA
jgi:hypothetical protein